MTASAVGASAAVSTGAAGFAAAFLAVFLAGAAAPAASVTMQHINAAIGRGEGTSDLSILIEVLEGMSIADHGGRRKREE